MSSVLIPVSLMPIQKAELDQYFSVFNVLVNIGLSSSLQVHFEQVFRVC